MSRFYIASTQWNGTKLQYLKFSIDGALKAFTGQREREKSAKQASCSTIYLKININRNGTHKRVWWGMKVRSG